jgi:hypothetical protein
MSTFLRAFLVPTAPLVSLLILAVSDGFFNEALTAFDAFEIALAGFLAGFAAGPFCAARLGRFKLTVSFADFRGERHIFASASEGAPSHSMDAFLSAVSFEITSGRLSFGELSRSDARTSGTLAVPTPHCAFASLAAPAVTTTTSGAVLVCACKRAAVHNRHRNSGPFRLAELPSSRAKQEA